MFGTVGRVSGAYEQRNEQHQRDNDNGDAQAKDDQGGKEAPGFVDERLERTLFVKCTHNVLESLSSS